MLGNGLIRAFSTLEYDRNPEVANYFIESFRDISVPASFRKRIMVTIDAMSFLHQGRDSLHPIAEEYADTLVALPGGSHKWTREEMVMANGLFEE